VDWFFLFIHFTQLKKLESTFYFFFQNFSAALYISFSEI
jgi:hypothetical protein